MKRICWIALLLLVLPGVGRAQVSKQVEVTKAVALEYLRRHDIPTTDMAEGLNLIVCEGFALGFVKRVGARCNNMYPSSLKIVNM